MTRTLVLGSEGFVGRPLCRYLESQGEDVIRFDITRGIEEDGRVASLDLDTVDFVYFLAWEVGGAKYLYERDAQFAQLDHNLALLSNLMPQLHRGSAKFLFVSSQLAEHTDNVYGVTKRLGEVWTALIDGVRCRLWNVYGEPELPSKRSHVIADFVYQALKHGEIRMLTSGEERRQFIHVDDVCRALHLAQWNQSRALHDITSFEWTSVSAVAETVGQLTGAQVIPGNLLGSTPDTPMKGRLAGWWPRITLEEGLRMTIDSTRKVM